MHKGNDTIVAAIQDDASEWRVLARFVGAKIGKARHNACSAGESETETGTAEYKERGSKAQYVGC